MQKDITLEDCERLQQDFNEYSKTAEQHQFTMLMFMDMAMTATIGKFMKFKRVTDQKEARAMFETVLKTIGKDCDEYLANSENL